ncbi:MAG TPA: DUF2807 domain-containing protein [Pyrinomonadaceae bacterium]|nr:DUF2807 domain-containing protein [Pyrinomonadaceae bacterium]
MYKPSRSLMTSVLVLLFLSPAIRVSTAHSESMLLPSGSQTVKPLERFSSVELRNGGKAILRHGPIQRVTLLKGSLDYTQVTIANRDRLVIDKCRNKCPRGYELEVEIVAPDVAGISIADGGTVEVRGSFPRREEIRVAVSQGGAIDLRAMTVDSITASIDQGGTIFAKPQSTMIASIRHGGQITYWGDAQVRSSVRDGGVVSRGTADEADKPLSDFDTSLQAVPPVPPVPPIQPNEDWF